MNFKPPEIYCTQKHVKSPQEMNGVYFEPVRVLNNFYYAL
jgi:hypothetical protein